MKGTHAAGRLQSFVQRIERLEQEKREISEQIADVKREAKHAGFDTKVVNQMVRERRMTEAQRQEWQALCETYRAALGMLDGTPLGDRARERFERKEDDEDRGDPLPFEQTPTPAAPQPPTAEEIAEARDVGGDAQKAGKKVTENPHPAGDKRRAAWDEGWCSAAGGDGMEVPEAWRRSKSKAEEKKAA